MPEDDEEEDEEEFSELSEKDTSIEASVTDDAHDSDAPATTINVAQESTSSGEVIVEQSVQNVLRPDLSEIRKENNRDTMSYLKSKRISRHKSNEVTDTKKFKSSD